MSRIQYFFASIILFFALLIGTFFLFKTPLPYAYDSLNDSLTRTMRQNGVFWAKVSVEGDNIILSGNAPNREALVFAKSLVQRSSGISANIVGVNVNRNTLDGSGDLPDDNIDTSNDQIIEQEYSAANNEAYLESISYNSISKEQQSGAEYNTTVSQPKTIISNANIMERSPPSSDIVITAFAQSKSCNDPEVPDAQDFVINFAEASPAISADSLGDLDQIAQYNRSCKQKVHIKNAADVEQGSMDARKIDEIRYYLMSSGVLTDSILLD